MDQGAWLGLGLGLFIGGIYGWLQLRELRQRSADPLGRVRLLGPVFRLVTLMILLLAAVRFTEADKYWLTGSLAVAYTAPLVWGLRSVVRRK